jgi:hypothetical protein
MSFGPLRPGEPDFPAVNPIPVDPQVTGYIPPGSVSNAQLAFGLDVRKFQGVGIKVYRSTDQVISDATTTNVTFNTVLTRHGFADPGASFTTVTAPYAGAYLILSQEEWEANGTNRRLSWIYVNGVQRERDTRNGTASNTTGVALPAMRILAAGDTIGVQVRQTSGGNLNIIGGADSSSLTVIFLYSL